MVTRFAGGGFDASSCGADGNFFDAQGDAEACAVAAAEIEPAVGIGVQAVVDVDGGQFGVQAAFELREDVQQDDGIKPAAEGGFDAAGAEDDGG